MDKKLEKIIDLKLDASDRDAERHGLIQYDYGQILRIHGLDLPPAVEIQFSYREKGGTTENRVGTTKDGITEVQIPDAMLKNNGTTQDYAIWVFIYVTDETSGNTVCRIKLYVDSRPAPGEVGEDQDESHILDEAVNAVNAAAERAETAEAEARSAADSATAAAESARKSAEAVAQEKNTAISAIQDQQAASEKAITDHTDAEIGRQNAATKEATDALTGQITKAETADNKLKTTVEDAGKKKAELAASIHAADTAKGRVDNSTELAETAKKNLDKSVQDASDQKAELDKKVTRAEELDTSLGEKISEATQLKSDLQTTGEEAVAAINAAGEDNLKQINEAAEKITENIENLTPDDQNVGKNPWSSKQIIDALCPEFTESGNPVTCYPVENYPLDIVASWKPIQEGGGNPYPAGCGPNLLDSSQLSPAAPGYCYGLSVTIDGDIIRINGIPNISEDSITITFKYAFSKQSIVTDYKAKAFVTKGTVINITTIQSDGSLVATAKLAADTSVNIEMRVMFYTGEEPSVYYPYENIRPIHERDNVKIARCSENILNIKNAEEEKKIMNGITYERSEDGSIHVYGTSTGRSHYYLVKPNKNADVLIPAGTYTFTPFCMLQDNTQIYFAVDGKGSFLSYRPKDNTQGYVTGTIANNVHKIDAYIVIEKAGVTVDMIIRPMVIPGVVAPADYEGYKGICKSIQLQREEVYGGALSTITGIGTADWAVRTFDGTENWYTWGVDKIMDGVTGFYSYDVNDYNAAYVNDAISSHMINSKGYSWGGGTEGIGFSGTDNSKYVIFSINDKILQDTSTNEKAIESWKAYLAEQYAAGTPVQIAYKLADPIPFQIEGEQILALKGINNILTDADAVTVTGREDPVHYVDKKFAELSAAIVASASEAE